MLANPIVPGVYRLRDGGLAQVVHVGLPSRSNSHCVEGKLTSETMVVTHRYQAWTPLGRWYCDGVGFEHHLDLVDGPIQQP